MKKGLIFLFAVFVFAFILRVMFLRDSSLTFGYDQARDALVSQQILAGDWKILGPPASTPGLYHGVFYYYLLSPSYLIGNGSPIAAAYWIAFLNSLTVFIVFYLTFLLSKKTLPAIVVAVLFAVSFESVQYATWLSNPTIGVWTVPLMYLGLWLWTKEKKWWGAVLTGLGLGLSIQAEVFLLYQLVPLGIWLFLNKKQINKKSVIIFVISLLFSISTMILAEFKFGFRSFSGLYSLTQTGDTVIAAKGFGDIILLFFNQLGRVFSLNSYPGNVGYGAGLVFVLVIYSLVKYGKKESWPIFLTLWLFSHLSVVSLGGTSTPFLLVGIGPAVSLLLGIVIYKLFTDNKKVLAVVIFIILLFGSITMNLKQNSKGSVIFAIQKDLILKKQLAVIDYTYEKGGGKAFSVNSVTSPLWINIVWSYLYKWYGLPKYGYLPVWHGKDQIGQIDALSKDEGKVGKYFLIIEPMAGIPLQYRQETLDEENYYSKLKDTQFWGEIEVQEREKINR
jgi:hypothetical protein